MEVIRHDWEYVQQGVGNVVVKCKKCNHVLPEGVKINDPGVPTCVATLPEIMVAAGISTMKEGQALWALCANTLLTYGNPERVVQTGSFRHLGSLIASICGGDYMDYYCAESTDEEIKIVAKKLYSIGANIWIDPSYHIYFEPDVIIEARRELREERRDRKLREKRQRT